MSGWFTLLVLLAAINPPRLRPHFDTRTRPMETLGAMLVTFVVTVTLAALGDSILDALQITPETWHIGAGAVALLVGGKMLIAPELTGIETPDGWAAVLAPFTFPLLFTPQLAALAILQGTTGSVAAAAGWLAVALVVTLAIAAVPHRRPVLWAASARFFGAVLAILAVALIVGGIRAV
jgi:small neutral amino acid transporter SnatA (MarC family)